MKKSILLLFITLSLLSCSKSETNLVVTGKIQDLKKGTLYLQKIEDTSLVTLDSVVIKGDPTFSFNTYIENPQVLYLYLNKVDNSEYDDRLLFFAEPGEMTLNTTLDNFETDVIVEGSENHKKLMEYRKLMDRFNSQNLDLIKEGFEAQQAGNEELIETTNQKYENLLKRRYLFTVNFALNNKNYEVAPYLAISEVFDANIKYLDTIYNSLTPEIRTSKYGQSLGAFLEERKEEEEEEEEKLQNEVEEKPEQENV